MLLAMSYDFLICVYLQPSSRISPFHVCMCVCVRVCVYSCGLRVVTQKYVRMYVCKLGPSHNEHFSLRTTNNSWGPEEFPSLKAVCVAEEDFVSIPKLSSHGCEHLYYF